MTKQWIKPLLLVSLLAMVLVILTLAPMVTDAIAQAPTSSIPTVTSTPRKSYIVVNALAAGDTQINVRAQPNSNAEKVGVMLNGQEAVALGVWNNWVLIEYPTASGTAWVYGNLVIPYGDPLPELPPPATATPRETATVDAALLATFQSTLMPTRLSTYTDAAPLIVPTFAESLGPAAPGGIPMGVIVIGLAALGLFLGLISIVRGR